MSNVFKEEITKLRDENMNLEMSLKNKETDYFALQQEIDRVKRNVERKDELLMNQSREFNMLKQKMDFINVQMVSQTTSQESKGSDLFLGHLISDMQGKVNKL